MSEATKIPLRVKYVILRSALIAAHEKATASATADLSLGNALKVYAEENPKGYIAGLPFSVERIVEETREFVLEKLSKFWVEESQALAQTIYQVNEILELAIYFGGVNQQLGRVNREKLTLLPAQSKETTIMTMDAINEKCRAILCIALNVAYAHETTNFTTAMDSYLEQAKAITYKGVLALTKDIARAVFYARMELLDLHGITDKSYKHLSCRQVNQLLELGIDYEALDLKAAEYLSNQDAGDENYALNP